jgi:hypothetical protein
VSLYDFWLVQTLCNGPDLSGNFVPMEITSLLESSRVGASVLCQLVTTAIRYNTEQEFNVTTTTLVQPEMKSIYMP